MINDEYFNYLVDKIGGYYYEELLWKLFSLPFDVKYDDMNSSRAYDGLRLREEFVGSVAPMKCTFLEMMIALAQRLDNDIMWEEKYGDRTSVWFWCFIDNMGLTDATNDNWNDEWDYYTEDRVRDIMDRRYDYDGTGGMFIVRSHPETDLRAVDIWRQMVWWCDESIKEGTID